MTSARRWQWPAIGLCVALTLLSAMVMASLGYSPEGVLPQMALYGGGYLVAGSIASLRRPDNPVGPVMLATSVAISLSFLTLFPEPLISRAAGLIGSVANILVVWIMLAAPAGRLDSTAGRWALGVFSVVVLLAATLEDLETRRLVWLVGMLVSLALVVIVANRWFSASAPSRRSLTPVVVAGIAAALVHALDFLAGVLLIPVTPGSPIQVADALSRALVPYGFLLGLLRLRIARGAVADLVVELSETPPPGRMRDALAGALGDPTLEIVYWSDDAAGYLDEHGRTVDLAPGAGGRAVTLLDREGRPLAAILHDPALAEDPGLVAAVGAAVRMAVDNERLTAEVEAQLADVQASRARIVTAGDAERRRLERDLHDGAQQRLVALSLALRRASSEAGSSGDDRLSESLEDATQLVRDALAELRELARGIHPAVLTESGLTGALRALATSSPVQVELGEIPAERFAPEVEATAYFFVSEALANVAKHAPAARAHVRIEHTPDALIVEVADDGPGGAQPSAGSGLQGLDDRVAAAGGRFALASPVGRGTLLRAELPVAHGPAAAAQAPTVS